MLCLSSQTGCAFNISSISLKRWLSVLQRDLSHGSTLGQSTSRRIGGLWDLLDRRRVEIHHSRDPLPSSLVQRRTHNTLFDCNTSKQFSLLSELSDFGRPRHVGRGSCGGLSETGLWVQSLRYWYGQAARLWETGATLQKAETTRRAARRSSTGRLGARFSSLVREKRREENAGSQSGEVTPCNCKDGRLPLQNAILSLQLCHSATCLDVVLQVKRYLLSVMRQ